MNDPFKILVVDDEAPIRDSLCILLESKGYQVDQAADGVEALEKVAVDSFDIIFTDIKMPNMDGIEVLRRVKERDPGIEVIIITAFASMENTLKAIKLGAFDYLTKPFLLDQVKNVVARAGEKRKKYISERGTIKKAEKLEISSDALMQINRLLDEKLFDLTVASKVDEAVRGANTFDKVVEKVMMLINELIDCQVSGLLLLERREMHFYLHAKLGQTYLNLFKEKIFEYTSSLKGIKFDYSVNEITERIIGGKKHLIKDAQVHNVQSFYSVPLIVRNSVVGVFSISSSSAKVFDQKATDTFINIVNRSALAFDNIMLNSQLKELVNQKSARLMTINKIGELIYSISDLNKLLVLFMELVLKTINAQYGSLALLENGSLVNKVDWEFSQDMLDSIVLVSGKRVIDHVFEEQSAIVIENLEEDSRVDKEKLKIKSGTFLCIPLIAQEKAVGVLNLLYKNCNPVSIEEMDTLITIANLATTAIENARLYQQALKEQELEQELEVAHKIQTNLLPAHLPQGKDFQMAALSVPASDIGGDYYDYFEISDDLMGLVVVDVVGKGIPAAIIMTEIRSILRTHAVAYASPKQTLEKINAIINKDPVVGKFVPMFFCVFNKKDKTLTYANGGHEPAILYKNSTKETMFLDTEGTPVGGFSDGSYEEKRIKLSEKDLLLLYTDGVVEAVNNKRKRFGMENLAGLIKSNCKKNAKQITERIYSSVLEFTKGCPQNDDLTLLTLKMEPPTADFLFMKEEDGVKTVDLRVSSDPRMISLVRARVSNISKEMGFSSSDSFDIKLAVNEAQANVIKHSYKGDVNQEILFNFNSYKDRLEIFITNYGKTIEPFKLKIPTDLEKLDGSGLGIFLINNLMDEIKYNVLPHVSTELKLVKYLKKKKVK